MIYDTILKVYEALQTYDQSNKKTSTMTSSDSEHLNSWKSTPVSRKTSIGISLKPQRSSSATDLAWNITDCPADFPQYTLAQVSEHGRANDCWIVIYDRVYDVTNFIEEHPGGEYIMLEHAGLDATIAFRSTRHGKEAFDMLEKYCIGILVETERLYTSSDEEFFLT